MYAKQISNTPSVVNHAAETQWGSAASSGVTQKRKFTDETIIQKPNVQTQNKLNLHLRADN